jgi:hypothetical protein
MNTRAIYIGNNLPDNIGLTGYFNLISGYFNPDDIGIPAFRTNETFIYFPNSSNKAAETNKWYKKH